MCDSAHKKKSTPQILTDQHFCEVNHKKLKTAFHYLTLFITGIKKASLETQTGLAFQAGTYIAFLVNSITRSFAIALASSADACA
ncbi:MAG TPA: hypothetical protein DDY11_12465 [Leclercia adecarboxylata]|nr:hypothetical protein [Leclercia adecarboxylata]